MSDLDSINRLISWRVGQEGRWFRIDSDEEKWYVLLLDGHGGSWLGESELGLSSATELALEQLRGPRRITIDGKEYELREVTDD